MTQIFQQGGYNLGETRLISPFSQATPTIESRAATVTDLRQALQKKYPVIMSVGWFEFNAPTSSWIQHSGHYIGVYGYDYNITWNEDQIQLKVLNPERQYDTTRKLPVFDTITMQKFSAQPGVTYPKHRKYIFSGSGFGGVTRRAFVGAVLVLGGGVNYDGGY